MPTHARPQRHTCLTLPVWGGVIRRHDAIARALATIIHDVTGAMVHLEKRTAELQRILHGRMQEGQMDLIVTNLNGRTVYIDVTIVSPVIVSPFHLAQAANKPGYAALRAEFGKRQRYPIPNLIPFAIEIGGRPGPAARTFIRDLFREDGAARDQSIADAWSTLSTALHSATAHQLNKTAKPPAHPHHLQPPTATASF